MKVRLITKWWREVIVDSRHRFSPSRKIPVVYEGRIFLFEGSSNNVPVYREVDGVERLP
jgi:hypothetical protein